MKSWHFFLPFWKLLLRLYPPSFRQRFGAEILQVLLTSNQQQAQQRGDARALLAGLGSCGELCWGGLRERFEEIPMMNWLIAFLAVLCALLAGYVDFRNDEVQAAALVLIVSGFVLALARPQRALFWVPLIGLGIPLVHWLGRRFGYQPAYPVAVGGLAIFLLPAFVALLGASAGVLMRRVVKLL